MCRGADGLTPRARELVGYMLGQLTARLADEYGCDPAEITVGPVDIGPELEDAHA